MRRGWVVLVWWCLAPLAGAQLDERVRAELLADVTAVQPGRPFTVAVRLSIAPRWHVYWLNPGEAGEPIRVRWSLPPGFSAGALRFPVPRNMADGSGLATYGYEGEVVLLASITPPAELSAGPIAVSAEVSWLACESICVSGEARRVCRLAAGATAQVDEAGADLVRVWRERMPLEPGEGEAPRVQVEVVPGRDGGEVVVAMRWASDPPAKFEWFPPASVAVTFGAPRWTSAGALTSLVVPFERVPGQVVEAAPLTGVVAFEQAGRRRGLAVSFRLDAR